MVINEKVMMNQCKPGHSCINDDTLSCADAVDRPLISKTFDSKGELSVSGHQKEAFCQQYILFMTGAFVVISNNQKLIDHNASLKGRSAFMTGGGVFRGEYSFSD